MRSIYAMMKCPKNFIHHCLKLIDYSPNWSTEKRKLNEISPLKPRNQRFSLNGTCKIELA